MPPDIRIIHPRLLLSTLSPIIYFLIYSAYTSSFIFPRFSLLTPQQLKNAPSMMLRANLYPCYHLNSKKNFFTLCQYGNLPILSPCNVGDTLKPTQSPDILHPFHTVFILRTRFRNLCRRSLLLSVHCSRATSATSSRRFPPAIFSLGIRMLHTPPCHCI